MVTIIIMMYGYSMVLFQMTIEWFLGILILTAKQSHHLNIQDFGSTYLTVNGASVNMKIGTCDYLVQQNWIIDSNQSYMMGYSQLS